MTLYDGHLLRTEVPFKSSSSNISDMISRDFRALTLDAVAVVGVALNLASPALILRPTPLSITSNVNLLSAHFRIMVAICLSKGCIIFAGRIHAKYHMTSRK